MKKLDLAKAESVFKDVKKAIKNLSKPKQNIANTLLKEAKFCVAALEELKKEVEQYGVITSMDQGDYSIDRENPALKSYNTTIKNYMNLMKQMAELFDNLPVENKPDDLEEFLK